MNPLIPPVLFDRPGLLLAAPAAWVLVALLSGRPGLSRPRRVAAALTRSLILTLLILATAGPHLAHRTVTPRETLLIGDRSGSVSPAGRAETEALRQRLAGEGPVQEAAFGGAAGSDARGAILLAATASATRIVIVTDGHLEADAAPMLADLEAAKRAIGVLGLESEADENETAPPATPGFVLPDPIRADEPVEIVVSSEGAEQVEILSDGESLGIVPAEDGIALLVHPGFSAGLRRLTAVARGAGGAAVGSTEVMVRGALPILVLGVGRDAPLVRALVAMGLDVRVSPEASAAALDGVRVAIATGDFRLPSDGGAVLPFVRRGGGLLVATAEPIVYEGEAVADLLPAEALLPEPEPAPPPPDPPEPEKPPENEGASPAEVEKEALTMTLVLVLDRSGSMLGEKIAVARAACLAAAETLDPGDRIGILAFNSENEWVRRPAPAGDVSGLIRAVSRIRPDGGTEIFAALEEAGNVIRGEPSAIRHVILVSDGQDILTGFRKLVTGLTDERITVSTIGIGTDHDARLLGSIANWGAGRFYDAINPRELPRVVTLDTRRVIETERPAEPIRTPDITAGSKGPDEPPEAAPPAQPPPRPPVTLRIATPVPFLAELEFPPLPEVAPIRPRFPAQTALSTADGSPALCFWRYGKGRVALMPADLSGFSEWPDLPRFAAQIARFLAGGEAASDGPVVEAEVEGDALIVRSARAVAAAFVRIGERETQIPLSRIGPGTFAAELPPAPAREAVFVRIEAADGTVVRATGVSPRGPEDHRGTNQHSVARLAAASGRAAGAIPPPPEPERVPGRDPLQLPLIIAAVLLLPLDTLIRRFA